MQSGTVPQQIPGEVPQNPDPRGQVIVTQQGAPSVLPVAPTVTPQNTGNDPALQTRPTVASNVSFRSLHQGTNPRL